jgi:predicted acylesterase/phospholipase RssA
MDPGKLYRSWDYWLLEGAFFRGGLFNDTIFIDYMDEVLPKNGLFKKITVGATDTKTGEFVRFTEEIGYTDMVYRAARASAAIPGVFEYVNYNNMTLIDGGVLINLDIGGAINRCMEQASSHEEITIDIVM